MDGNAETEQCNAIKRKKHTAERVCAAPTKRKQSTTYSIIQVGMPAWVRNAMTMMMMMMMMMMMLMMMMTMAMVLHFSSQNGRMA